MIDAPSPDDLDRLEVFGQPWHGLGIASGSDMIITLPNDETLTLVDQATMAGDTRLVQLPDLPDPRTTAEAEADLLIGQEWRKTAILNDSYVGADKWLYQSSTGEIWELRTTGDPGGQVRRFGVFGGGGTWVTTATPDELPTTAVLQDVRPDLKRALFAVEIAYSENSRSCTKREIYEVTVSDSGTLATCTISKSLIGTYGEEGREVSETTATSVGIYDDEGECYEVDGEYVDSRHIIDTDYRAVAARYQPDGVTVTVIESRIVDEYVYETTWTGYGCDWTQVDNAHDYTHTKTLDILIDGVSIASDEMGKTMTLERRCTPDGSGTYYRLIYTHTAGDLTVTSKDINDYHIDCDDYPCEANPPILTDLTGWLPADDLSGGDEGGTGLWRIWDADCDYEDTDTAANYLNLSLKQDGLYDGMNLIRRTSLHALANNLWAIRRWDWPNLTVTYGPEYITPAGLIEDGPVITNTLSATTYQESGACYGSWNPLTEELSVGNTNRCWF